MPRDHFRPPRDPESKRPGGPPRGAPRNTERAADRAGAWGPRRGRSGYGVESIRPHLLAQLEQQKLLHPTFPPESEPDDGDQERGGRRQ